MSITFLHKRISSFDFLWLQWNGHIEIKKKKITFFVVFFSSGCLYVFSNTRADLNGIGELCTCGTSSWAPSNHGAGQLRAEHSPWRACGGGICLGYWIKHALQDYSNTIDHISLQDQVLNFWWFSGITFILTFVCETSHSSKNLRHKLHQKVLRQSLYLLVNLKWS